MQRNVIETVLGGVVIIVAAGFLTFAYKTIDIAPRTGYEITASFQKIDGLQTGSPVRISGVTVGQVLSFTLDPETYSAVVRMNIDDGVKIPTDTAAVIASEGLLNGKFLSLEPGGDEEILKPGGKIQYTQSTPGLEQLLGQVIFSMSKDGDKK